MIHIYTKLVSLPEKMHFSLVSKGLKNNLILADKVSNIVGSVVSNLISDWNVSQHPNVSADTPPLVLETLLYVPETPPLVIIILWMTSVLTVDLFSNN